MPVFSWSLLLALAPDLIPLIVGLVINIESTIRGALAGEIKKSKVMDAIKAILQTKDYFVNSDSAEQSEIYALVDQAIDFIVSAFNYLGLFKTSKKLDFSPREGE